MQPRAPCNTDIFFILPKVQSFLIIRRSLKLQEIHHHIVLRLVQIHLQNFNIETCLEHISRPPLPVQNRVEYSARTLCSTDSVFESITATYGTLKQQKSDYIEADRSSIAQMWHADSAGHIINQPALPSLERKHQPGWALTHGLITHTKFISQCCKWHEPS